MASTGCSSWILFVALLATATNTVASAGRLFGMTNLPAAFSVPKRTVPLNVDGQPEYAIGSVDLSKKWIELVGGSKVSATVQLVVDEKNTNLQAVGETGNTISVSYGVRLVQSGSKFRCQEFAIHEACDGGGVVQSELVKSINETLSSSNTLTFRRDNNNFAAQLQLVRTLRPPPSPGFSGSTTSTPPPYDATTDSFVTGPLRLELRPLVSNLQLPELTTPWDVYHNVSPADTRGHFLLLPTLSEATTNWRGQAFLPSDCHDMVHLAGSIEPVGSLLLGFNSVGAGASQNHIHCHAWPSPPISLLNNDNGSLSSDDDVGDTEEEPIRGWNCYAVSKVKSIYDFCDIQNGDVEVSYLKYPVFCVQLSASQADLELLGQAVATVVQAIGDSPYNIAFWNREQQQVDDDKDIKNSEGDVTVFVDAFVFARSKERSDILPSLKLGISEMMGVFHAQSHSELSSLAPIGTTQQQQDIKEEEEEGPMSKALADVSYEEDDALWNKIVDNLRHLDGDEYSDR